MSTPKPMAENGKCRATSQRSGKQCGRLPTSGLSVCQVHGGGSATAKAAGRRRLLEHSNNAIDRLVYEVDNAAASSDRQKAANSILDRAGISRVQELDSADAKEMLKDQLLALRESKGNIL